MTRLFLDTNIVVDLLERREPFCQDAEGIVSCLFETGPEIVLDDVLKDAHMPQKKATKTLKLPRRR